LRKLLSLLAVTIGGMIALRIIADLFTRQLDEGSEVSDEFKRVSALNGIEFSSRAGGLRSGTIAVMMGGARVDLRSATLDPAGAKLEIDNTLGGVQVLVRPDWAVRVDEDLRGGGEIDVDVAAIDELPEDAPQLQIHAMTSLAATQIVAEDA
jgi:hypothetical protein